MFKLDLRMPHLSLLNDCVCIFIHLQRVCIWDPFSLLKLCGPQWILSKQFRADLSLWSPTVRCGWVIRRPQSPSGLMCKCRSNRKLNLYLSPHQLLSYACDVNWGLVLKWQTLKFCSNWMWMCIHSACGKDMLDVKSLLL